MNNFDFKKYLTENKLGAFGRFNGYVDLNPINEAETGNNTFNVTLSYADYPSISNSEQRIAIGQFMDLVESLGGTATKTKDQFSEVDFEVSGIASFEQLQAAYNKEAEDGDSEYGFLGSWALKAANKEIQEAEQDMNLPKKPSKIYASNKDWMTDEINGQRYDDWVAYIEDGIICWFHNQVPTEQLYVAITPGWDGPGTPMETIFNSGDETGEYDSIEEFEFSSFDDYLNAVKFYLDKIDDNIHAGKYKKYGVDLAPDTSNDKVYEGTEDEEVKLKDLNYNIVTTPWEFEKTWKDMYGEDFETEYSGAHSYLTHNYKNFNILDLGSVWERMYGEDFLENYPGIAKWLFSNEGRQSSKDKVVPKNDKIYEIGSETMSQEEEGTIKEIDDEEGSALDLYREAENDFFSDPEVKAAIKTLKAKCGELMDEMIDKLGDEKWSEFVDELYGYTKDKDPDDYTFFDAAWYDQ